MNAKKELMEHVEGREVKYVRVIRRISYKESDLIEGALNDVLPRLDFEYDDGYGMQELEGTVWYSDGTWSEREEYDGSEWWAYRKCPIMPIS